MLDHLAEQICILMRNCRDRLRVERNKVQTQYSPYINHAAPVHFYFSRWNETNGYSKAELVF